MHTSSYNKKNHTHTQILYILKSKLKSELYTFSIFKPVSGTWCTCICIFLIFLMHYPAAVKLDCTFATHISLEKNRSRSRDTRTFYIHTPPSAPPFSHSLRHRSQTLRINHILARNCHVVHLLTVTLAWYVTTNTIFFFHTNVIKSDGC